MRWWIATLMMLLLTPRGEPALAEPPSVGDDAAAADEKLLESSKVPSTGPELLRLLRERTLPKEMQERIAEQVRLLGDPSYAVRVQAGVELVKAGELARPFLQDAVAKPGHNLEIARRAELCLRKIQDNPEAPRTAAVIRLLGRRKPAEAAETLLAYFPFITDQEVLRAAQDTLNLLAVKDGKADASIAQALKDQRPKLRGAAAEALIRGGGLAQKPLVIALLQDPWPEVRLQLALALVEKKDKAAVPDLIDLLGQVPTSEHTWPAEELLYRLAGDKAPMVRLGDAQARIQWQAWWAKNEATVDLDQLDEVARLQGLTVITQLGKGTSGRVYELAPGKQVRWQIDGLQYPVDVQVLGNNRVLLAEYLGRRVTERDFQGKVLWEKSIDMPIACQRLSGGRTFIATRRQLVIVDAAGKEVFTHHGQNTSIAAAACALDGHMYLVYSGGLFVKLNPQGREVTRFQVSPIYTIAANVDVLPAGRILLPHYRDNKVAEYDITGKIVWEARVTFPTAAVRLGNGHTLVTASNRSQVVEIDRQGRVVWEYQTDSRPLRARRR